MGEHSAIEWTDHTFNPWIGCTKVSEGCKNCYAENQMDHRWNKVQWGPGKPRVRTAPANWLKPLTWDRKALASGVRPRVFCASLADWLDPEVPIEWLADLLALIQATPHLDWLLLTKRPELWRRRMAHVFGVEICENPGAEPGRLQLAWDWFHGKDAPANIWLGCTVENQKATARIPHLLSIPAKVHFLSCEPMCGPVDLAFVPWPEGYELPDGDLSDGFEPLYQGGGFGVDWVICGGESGPDARPMHPDWARGLRDQCEASGLPFHFKQWGEWAPYGGTGARQETLVDSPGSRSEHMVKIGKARAGRLLDGREWNGLPELAREGAKAQRVES